MSEENERTDQDNQTIDIEPESISEETSHTEDTEEEQEKVSNEDKKKEKKQKFAEVGNRIFSSLKSLKFDPLCFTKAVDGLINFFKDIFPPSAFESMSSWFVGKGHVTLITGAVFTFLLYMFAGFRSGSFGAFCLMCLAGLGYVLLLIILQYTVVKFINAGQMLVNSSPSRLASRNFLDCIFLFMEVIGVILLISFARQGWIKAVVGLGAFALCDLVAWVALHPSMANIVISDEANAGEEAIGILSFLVKSIVKMVPMAFGVGTFFGMVAMIMASIKMLFNGGNMEAGRFAFNLMVVSALLPFASYVLFAVYHLTVDVLRSILVIPGKLDKLDK